MYNSMYHYKGCEIASYIFFRSSLPKKDERPFFPQILVRQWNTTFTILISTRLKVRCFAMMMVIFCCSCLLVIFLFYLFLPFMIISPVRREEKQNILKMLMSSSLNSLPPFEGVISAAGDAGEGFSSL